MKWSDSDLKLLIFLKQKDTTRMKDIMKMLINLGSLVVYDCARVFFAKDFLLLSKYRRYIRKTVDLS